MSKNFAFSDRLKEIINERNIRQADLCQMTQIGKSAMSQYLSGAFQPKQQNLLRLAEALDVSEAWLMGYNVPQERKRSAGAQLGARTEEDSRFYYTVPDDSMMNAHIPPHAEVLVERSSVAEDRQLVVCAVDSQVMLRRYLHTGEHIFLMPENNSFDPEVYTEEDLSSGRLRILGVAKKVIIDL